MSNSVKRLPRPLSPAIRFFLGACIFCLGVHFLVNDLALFNLDAAIRHLPGKAASLRIADNDHQEDPFAQSGLDNLFSSGLTLPVFHQPVHSCSRAISPLFSPPKI